MYLLHPVPRSAAVGELTIVERPWSLAVARPWTVSAAPAAWSAGWLHYRKQELCRVPGALGEAAKTLGKWFAK